MNKTIKKILISMILFMTILLVKNANVFASTYEYNPQQEAFNEFLNKKYESTYNFYIGEKMLSTSWGIHWYLQPTIKISNPSVIGIENKDEIKAKKAGTSEVTVELTYAGQTAKKSFKINVMQSKENTKLDSNKNDVINISQNTEAKNQVLLANSELWNADKKTFKLTKKETGNVAKYVYSSVYNNRGDVMDNSRIGATLKRDKELTLKNSKSKLNVSKVKDISDFGYLTQSGKFYFYQINNGKIKLEKRLTGVSKIITNYILIKDGKTYAVSGTKISDFEAVAVDPSSTCADGLILNKKGEAYYYYYDYGYEYVNNEYKKTGKEGYKIKKVATKVECLLGNYNYKTKSGKIEKYKTGYEWIDSEKAVKKLYLFGSEYNSNILELRTNSKIYLNDVKILDKVDNIYYADGTQDKSALIVRKDGSIWKLDIAGKAKLSKVRSGKEEYKRISAPTKVTATKSGNNNVKIKWNNVEGAKEYTIYKSTSKNGKYTKIGTSKTNSYKDKGIEIGKTYYYKVVANYSDSSFDSAKSSAAKIKIPKATKKVSAKKKSKTSLKVAYEKVSGVSGYEIEYSTAKDFKKATVTDTKKTSVTIKNLKNSKTYYVRVRTYNIINGQKVYSSYSDVQKVVLK